MGKALGGFVEWEKSEKERKDHNWVRIRIKGVSKGREVWCGNGVAAVKLQVWVEDEAEWRRVERRGFWVEEKEHGEGRRSGDEDEREGGRADETHRATTHREERGASSQEQQEEELVEEREEVLQTKRGETNPNQSGEDRDPRETMEGQERNVSRATTVHQGGSCSNEQRTTGRRFRSGPMRRTDFRDERWRRGGNAQQGVMPKFQQMREDFYNPGRFWGPKQNFHSFYFPPFHYSNPMPMPLSFFQDQDDGRQYRHFNRRTQGNGGATPTGLGPGRRDFRLPKAGKEPGGRSTDAIQIVLDQEAEPRQEQPEKKGTTTTQEEEFGNCIHQDGQVCQISSSSSSLPLHSAPFGDCVCVDVSPDLEGFPDVNGEVSEEGISGEDENMFHSEAGGVEALHDEGEADMVEGELGIFQDPPWNEEGKLGRRASLDLDFTPGGGFSLVEGRSAHPGDKNEQALSESLEEGPPPGFEEVDSATRKGFAKEWETEKEKGKEGGERMKEREDGRERGEQKGSREGFVRNEEDWRHVRNLDETRDIRDMMFSVVDEESLESEGEMENEDENQGMKLKMRDIKLMREMAKAAVEEERKKRNFKMSKDRSMEWNARTKRWEVQKGQQG